MDKLKQVLSGGHKHDEGVASGQGTTSSPETSQPTSNVGGLTGEGSHLASANKGVDQKGTGSTGEYHPIYDQFTGHAPSGPTSTGPTGSNAGTNFSLPTHSKDTTHPQQGSEAYPGVAEGLDSTHKGSTLHPDTAGTPHRPHGPREDVSNASIKSGVLGDPPSHSQYEANAPGSTDNSHLGRDAALGTGAGLGAGTLAGHELNRDKDADLTGTDRSFPLAGGVASSGQHTQDPTSTHQPITSGTTGNTGNAGLNDGREGLAGAAASAAWAGHERSEPGATSGTGSGPHFTRGPHVTDTANRLDPHVPGAFPDPTPTEEKQEPTTQSHTGRDAALAGAGAATAGGLAGRQHEARTAEPTTRSTAAPSATEKPTSEHHYGRDAALAGGTGAAGLGAYEASKHHGHDTRDPTSTPQKATGTFGAPVTGETSPYSSKQIDPRVNAPSSTTTGATTATQQPTQQPQHHYGRDAALAGGAGTAGVGAYEAGKHHHDQPSTTHPSRGLEEQRADPTSKTTQGAHDSTRPSEHHYGRDAALAGGAGAAGLGAYEASQQYGKPESGPASSTIGPHKSNILNVLDPRVQPDPQLQKQHQAGPTAEDPASRTVGPHKSNVANIADPRVQPEPEKQKGHTTVGPHKSDTLNKADPKVQSDPSRAQAEDQHHYGRDAALAGGAGAAGLGAYEASKHHGGQDATKTPSTAQGTAQQYGDHHLTQPSAALNEQRYDPTAQGAHDPTKPKDHHYGRDAAIAGGTGAAGVGAYEASKHHGKDARDPTLSGTQYPTTAQHPTSATTATQPTTGQQGLERDPTKTNDHHYGRDAALAGGAGAAGVGAYEASKHHGHDSRDPTLAGTQQPPAYQQTTPTTHQPNKGYDTTPQTTQDPTKQHHYGRDAALAGGAGAAGVGAYEASKHREKDPRDPVLGNQQATTQHPTTATQQPTTTSQDPNKQHHYGRDAALAGGAGAAGVGAYEASKHREKDPRDPVVGNQQATTQHPTTATQQPTTNTQDPNKQHHYGRDAAVAGGTGAAGYGAYEAYKHHGEKDPRDPTATQQPITGQDAAGHQRYDSTADPQAKEKDHKARDAAAVGAAGAAGAGAEHEYSKREAEKAEKERLKEQKAHEKEVAKEEKQHQKEAEKEAKKEEKHQQKVLAAEEKKHQKEVEKEEKQHQKEAEKEAKKEEKQHQKVIAAEEKKHEKEAAKEEKLHQKEAEKEEKQHQKELEKEEKAKEKEQKPGLLDRILHRHKDENPDQLHSGVYTADDGRNKLHKEPPPGHPAREAAERQSGEHYGIDGKIGESNLVSGDRQTGSGVYGAHQPGDEAGRVTEPHTGLPMNTSLGDGRGGTDGNPNIHGIHGHESGATGERY